MKYFNHISILYILIILSMILYFPIKASIEWPNKELSERQYYELYILNKKYPEIFDLKIKMYEDKKITNTEFKQLKQKTVELDRDANLSINK